MNMSRSPRMTFPATIALMCLLLVISGNVGIVRASIVDSTTWQNAHATFYGGDDASGTMGGACGYGNNWATGYGVNTAALSTVLFNKGASCGACFEIQCILRESRWCYAQGGSIKVTATNFCPPNWYRYKDGWCNPPRAHFDLAYPMFARLARKVGGIIPVQFRRVPCVKQGGIRFHLNGNPWFLLVLVFNVGGVGDVHYLEAKGSSSYGFFGMTRNWGQNWELKQKLVGQALSFRLKLSDGSSLTSSNAINKYWRFGTTYACSQNFDPW